MLAEALYRCGRNFSRRSGYTRGVSTACPPNLLERGREVLAAERGQAPGRELRVGVEAEVAAERVRVAEDALDRIAVVDAVGAGHGVQQVHRLGRDLRRVSKVALEAQFGGRIRLGAGSRDVHRLVAVAAQDLARRVDARAR